MAKNILIGPDQVLLALLRGVNRIAEPVKRTLGPAGRNTIYERVQTNQPVSTRDGVTVANQIDSPDPFEQIGVELIKGVAREAVEQSGDGTTTSTLLAQAIFSEGVKAVNGGSNPVALKRGIEKAAAAVVAELQQMKIECKGEMLRQVATISANNDEFLGGLIATAMNKAGDDGVVTVEISRSPESSLEIVDGMQFGTGWLHEAFVTNPERRESVLEDVAILLYEKKVTTVAPLMGVLDQLRLGAKSFIVIAEDVTDQALATLAGNVKIFKSCAVRTPGGIDHLNDIAALTGATVITDVSGIGLKGVTMQHLGHAPRIVIKPQSTTVYSDGDSPSLQRRLAELRQQVKDAGDEGSRLRLQARLARLAGGIAVIRVGGKTEPEMLDRKDRIEDAMHAGRCAKSEGVLPGGGMALYRAGHQVPSLPDPDENIGAQIISRACLAPLRTLAENSGKSPEYVLEKVFVGLAEKGGLGWNARLDEYGDLVEMGVLDPLRVVRVALESAASVSGLMLITHSLVGNQRGS